MKRGEKSFSNILFSVCLSVYLSEFRYLKNFVLKCLYFECGERLDFKLKILSIDKKSKIQI